MSELSAQDLRWLDAAARAATPWLGTTAENPTVGALVVDEQRQTLLGRGITARGGRPHAEPQALEDAGGKARGRTLYVTLEPCNHWGRTPPCADAVIRAGIRRVVVGVADSDPRTAGEGVRRMADAGVEVHVADHEPSRRLHEGFLCRHKHGRPFITAKMAVSADGRIGLRDTPKHPVSGEMAGRWTHMQRALSDAVMVGAQTANLDDPKLNVRLDGLEDRSHLRIILAGRRALDTRIELIDGVSALPTVVIVPRGAELTLPVTVESIEVDAHNGRPDLHQAMKSLGNRGISRLLVECGAILSEALLAADLVDRFHLITSPTRLGPNGIPATILGGIDGRIVGAGLTEVDQQSLGEDKLRTFERA